MTGGILRTLWIKTACACFLLMSTAFLLSKRGDSETVVSSRPLTEFPATLGTTWQGREVGIDKRVLEILGRGDFAERAFTRHLGEPPVDLFVGYFPSQRTGATIHSPKNCLPGAGWSPVEAKYVSMPYVDGRQYSVNQYVIQKGSDRQLVLYWYQAHNRIVANEYAAKFFLVADSIRMNRSDGALIRILTPIASGENVNGAQQRALEFARDLVPILAPYVPV